MPRLPKNGEDHGNWGDILNEFLLVQHNSDGTHDAAQLLDAPAANDFILVSDPSSATGMNWVAKGSLQSAAADSGVDTGVAAGGTISQVLRKASNDDYDTIWSTLTKADVGLDQVDNTPDVNKPISSAVQTVLNAKVNKAGDTMTGALTVQNSVNSLDMHVVNTAHDATFSIRTLGATKAAYMNLYTNSGMYMAIAGWVGSSLKWRIGRFATANGFGIWVNDGVTQAAHFADDKTTRLYGGLITPVTTKNASYVLTAADHTVLVDATSSPVTITLPTAVGATGRQFIIKDWKGQAVSQPITIATTAGQTIDGEVAKVLNSNYAACTVIADGANWAVV